MGILAYIQVFITTNAKIYHIVSTVMCMNFENSIKLPIIECAEHVWINCDVHFLSPAPSYYSQPVYSPTAPLIVPTQQQPPPTKREKKTVKRPCGWFPFASACV